MYRVLSWLALALFARRGEALLHSSNHGSLPSANSLHLTPMQRHTRAKTRLHSSTIAPPRPPPTVTRTGGGDGDGLRPMTPDQVRVALAGFQYNAPQHCKTDADWEETSEMITRMRTLTDAIDSSPPKMGCKPMLLGSYKNGRVLAIAALETQFRGLPHGDVRLCVQLLAVHPAHSTRRVGFETLEALKQLGRDNALTLDCSALRAVPCLAVLALAGVPVLAEDPALASHHHVQAASYKERVRRTCFVVDDVPEWADLGPYWFEGQLPDGVPFWFRKRNQNQLSEFEVQWDHPEGGNATGSGTVGGARVIGLDELEHCTDIAGRAKVIDIRAALSKKLLAEAQHSSASMSGQGEEVSETAE